MARFGEASELEESDFVTSQKKKEKKSPIFSFFFHDIMQYNLAIEYYIWDVCCCMVWILMV